MPPAFFPSLFVPPVNRHGLVLFFPILFLDFLLVWAAEASQNRFLKSNIGSKREVLIEDYDEQAQAYFGYSDNYIRVFVKSEDDISKQIVRPSFTNIYKNGLLGVL